jgi:hypothetical protein
MSPKVETSNLIISPMVKSASIIESLVLKNLRIEPGVWSKENKNKGVIYFASTICRRMGENVIFTAISILFFNAYFLRSLF